MIGLTLQEEDAVIQVFRDAGFSGAWLLRDENDDDGEVLFYVPREELAETIDLTALRAKVKTKVPHRKVWVLGYSATAPTKRLY